MKIREASRDIESIQLHDILQDAKRLKLAPIDICADILQPIQSETGRNFLESKSSVANGHVFTLFVDQLVTEIFTNGVVENKLGKKPIEVVLACVEGNYHWLGLKLLQLAPIERSSAVRIFIPSLPSAEIMALADEFRPEIIGVSIFDRGQLHVIKDLQVGINKLCGAGYQPRIAIGGYAARSMLDEGQSS